MRYKFLLYDLHHLNRWLQDDNNNYYILILRIIGKWRLCQDNGWNISSMILSHLQNDCEMVRLPRKAWTELMELRSSKLNQLTAAPEHCYWCWVRSPILGSTASLEASASKKYLRIRSHVLESTEQVALKQQFESALLPAGGSKHCWCWIRNNIPESTERVAYCSHWSNSSNQLRSQQVARSISFDISSRLTWD